MKKYNSIKNLELTNEQINIRYNRFRSINNSSIGRFFPEYIIFLYFPCIYRPGYLVTPEINIETKFLLKMLKTIHAP